MDERIREIGAALWAEDHGGLGVALRKHGVWPPSAEEVARLFGGRSPEEILGIAARFIGFCRDKGWPRDPARFLGWCATRDPREWSFALAEERKRRDARKLTPQERASVEAFLGAPLDSVSAPNCPFGNG